MALAHPQGGQAKAEAFTCNINLEQTQGAAAASLRGKDLPKHLEAVPRVCFATASPALSLLDVYSRASLPFAKPAAGK